MSSSHSDLTNNQPNLGEILDAYRSARADLLSVPLDALYEDLLENAEAADTYLEMRMDMRAPEDAIWFESKIKE